MNKRRQRIRRRPHAWPVVLQTLETAPALAHPWWRALARPLEEDEPEGERRRQTTLTCGVEISDNGTLNFLAYIIFTFSSIAFSTIQVYMAAEK